MKKDMNIKIPEDQKRKCDAVIHSASLATAIAASGVAQIPLADNAVITPIQIGMIIGIGKIFEQKISKTAASAILGGFIASYIGRGVTQILWGWVPVFGNVINSTTAATLTETIGWMAVKNLSKGIIKESPLSKDESENIKDIELRLREELNTRADDFISGKKTKKDNKEEYYKLLYDFESDEVLSNVSEDDPLYYMYRSLADL